MKTASHSLLFLALVASGHAFAQDPHASHHGHGVAAKLAVDAHAGHVMPNTESATDPHAAHRGHISPANDHRGHAQHTAKADDPHAGHALPKTQATAQSADPHAAHHHPGRAAGDHGTHANRAMQTANSDPHAGQDMSSMDHSSIGADPHAGHAMPTKAVNDTPREPIPALTPDDFAAAFPVLKPHAMEHAPALNSLVVFDHLEGWNNGHGSGQAWNINAWFGNDIDRLWLRSEGQRSDHVLGDWSVDALYGHAISPWWDAVAGVRHDNSRQAPDLTRAGFGFQGMAPYKFEVSAMAYIGGPRKAELAFEVEYDMLLSNRLILQPGVKANVIADDDPRRGVGKGVSSVEAGLRLRYEITRRFAPYVGFVHERAFGDTADMHRDAGQSVSESRWVAGVRVWF
ncbi:MAG: copper resistance protein B [Stenotrophomonas sp.]